MRTLKVNLKENSYDIKIEKGILKSLGKEVKEVFNGEKIFIITDENVNKYYGDLAIDSLENEGFKVGKLVLKPGEETKSFETMPKIYDKLLDFKLTRKDLIITLGGGVIGDIGGFSASSFLRSVPFIQVPTSLLAQVDSSVGGKVGVDLPRGKNLVGAFYQPKKVIIDPLVLETLEDRFFRDGMAEVIKYGFIRSKDLYLKLLKLDSKEKLMENIEDIIYECCDIKRTIVERDEKDLGERMVLNFGHTLGHAIEKYYGFNKYTHGEGVAIGMYNIAKLSEEKGLVSENYKDLIKEILIQNGLPFNVSIDEKEEIIEAISLDKKNMGSTLKVIIMKSLGNAEVYDTTIDFFR
ncbi:3-dehydroquinate synthase [Clostridium chrysemydis]|uniref:3-dehydroquinate synthase n=1 Tax=Clostridium chrysemydis TaxID=2665504 RepID=UPI00188424A7|nr:3-dehydroquinate synthase [Clostridium chrysemydis]